MAIVYVRVRQNKTLSVSPGALLPRETGGPRHGPRIFGLYQPTVVP